MRNLLNFLIKYNYWFVFLLLEIASLVMLFRFNNYQQSVYFTSANAISGKVYEISGGIMSYFYLKSANETLLERNTILERQLTFLRNALKDRNVDSLEINRLAELSSNQYKTIPAHVINNSLNLVNNYLTLDKGKSDGILPEMGVIGEEGVVGIVYMASEHYSVVISALNSKSNISCKIKNSDYFGYLKWEHGDSRYAYLKDLPRHAEFNLGDTIITSGYSTVFPEGVMVGTVDDMADSNDGLSYLLKVKLATNFGKISNVRVITDVQRIEQEELELKTKAQ
ncbi:rod shape-determining protein MreC [Bacteroides graminisolvens]|uniref:rod shape-determining protein MreC n=1 Tax=Bacteroides graminisolvens TaxID=477666 RepID=UPI002409C2FC|nr:rod shape-determining protein MreC [Bacteroides graminisolvens]